MNSKKEEINIIHTQYKAFYLQYAGELIFFARKFVDQYTAEDIVHDLFLKIWDRKSTLIAGGDVKNYLFSMTQYACIDYIKHQTVESDFLQKQVREIQLDELNYYASSTDGSHDDGEIESLYASIEKLPPKRKDVFKKFFLEGQKHAEIARQLQISIRTVETHIYQGLKFLRENAIVLLFLALSCT
ncbi:MAG: RNA polymerase sigma-70 factor [Proteiniphilum sp.]|nr:RNA polymerase sigma-70 factor [Proteiniphilum sp.]